MDFERLKYEKQRLEKVKKAILEEKDYQFEQLRKIPESYKNRYSNVKWGDEDLVKHLISIATKRIKQLENLQDNPYFGRIDFLADDEKDIIKLYIGKTGLRNDAGEQLVIDWRAPICSLYYDQNLGRVSYDSPSGKISGELKLKSQILIQNGDIIDVRDTDLVSDDELLKPYLTSSADSRMKVIIASIQREQNKIIRKPLKNNLIIQGVAGGGKTSVALHRIAYLIYNEEGKYKSDQFMVIGPNKYFLAYISSILPELEAETVEQRTFTEIVENTLSEKMKIENQVMSLVKYLKFGKFDKGLTYKSSLRCKDDLDQFINDYIESLNGNIELYGEVLVSEGEIKRSFENTAGSFKDSSDIFIKNSIARIKDGKEKIADSIWEKYRAEFTKEEKYSPRHKEIIDIHDEAKRQLEKGCDKLIKNHFKKMNVKILDLYKQFITNIDKYCSSLDQTELDELKKSTLLSISKKNLTYEDLPALMYLKMKFKGCKEYDKIAQVIIDESQDFGMFHFYMLKKIFKNSTFSIFGDLAQSIYPYRSVVNWESVNNNIFDSSCEIMNLEKSYRTTIEIMGTANKISENLGISTAIPVIRHGDEVRFIDLGDKEKEVYMTSRIMEFINNKYETVAVICKTEEEALKVYGALLKKGIKVTNITYKDVEYNGGVCVTTGYLSKGLEFDAVIINDASEVVYNSNSTIDMKLLYIGMTRSLHNLDVIYNGKITKYLEDCIIREKVKIKK